MFRSRRRILIGISIGLLVTGAVAGILYWREYRLPTVPRAALLQTLEPVAAQPDDFQALQALWHRLARDSTKVQELFKGNSLRYRFMVHRLLLSACLYRLRGLPDSTAQMLSQAGQLAVLFRKMGDTDFLQRQVNYIAGLDEQALQQKLLVEYLYQQAQLNLGARQYGEAAHNYRRALRVARRVRDFRREVDCLIKLQYIDYYVGDYARALDLAKESLDLALAHGYRYRETWARIAVATTLFQFGRYSEALAQLDAALPAAQALHDDQALSRILERSSVAARRLGDLDRALESLHRAMGLARELNQQGEILNCLINFGLIYRLRGEYMKARHYYDQALDLARKLQDANVGTALLNLGHLCTLLGLYEEARQYNLAALDFYIQNGDKYYLAHALKNIGDLYLEQGSDSSAIHYYRRGLKELEALGSSNADLQPERLSADLQLSLGDGYDRLGEVNRALEAYRSALDRYNHIFYTEGQAHALIRVADVDRRQGRFAAARSALEKALQIAGTLNDPLLLSNAYFGLARVHADRGDLDASETALYQAIDTIERTRTRLSGRSQISYFARVQDVYDALIDLLARRGRFDAAFHYSERARARALFDLLRAHAGNGRTTSDSAIVPPPPVEIRRLLPAPLQLLEYKILPDRLLIFLVNRDTLMAHIVDIDAHELRERVLRFRRLLGAEDLTHFHQELQRKGPQLFHETVRLAQDLGRILIQPVLYDLSPGATIYVLPDDVLYYLPFAALALPGAADGRPPFLVESFPVALSPSAATLTALLTRGRRLSLHEGQLLAVGNPTGDLTAASLEAREIARLAPKATVLVEHEVSERTLRERLSRDIAVLHLATHAVIDDIHPLQSYLLLGKEPALGRPPEESQVQADDLLKTEEVSTLSLDHVALVTLSACYTAGGRLYRGEGLFGFTQAFLQAGVRTVLTSLWDVDDRYTRTLMRAFYQGLYQRGIDPVQALRRAQLSLIAQMQKDPLVRYPYPFAWAGFVLIGDYR